MDSGSSLNTFLLALNDLLLRERQAITHLRMAQLDEIQQEKTRLLKLLNRIKQPVDQESTELIGRIQANNERNRRLLESGLKLVRRLQDNVFRRLALTYAAHGRSLQIGAGPRLLSRSV
ncbi:hypothetical protein Despr_1848 [Desulfobulbus propionicus DSM 2032]|jgi:hypothetical protein|uniref:Flagellar protein FlgN n=1 Tax=Desulfobulbus propionicus (strain ATCC 33891 / DSM 2032 / VKM B-1956 / 1pr3) TaxID=577650 RepID=A0A7U4DPB9_DESPD|nr:hypothetical protein Despr_1848 [Desulfobulbus propionicus DSM 2032]